MNQDLLDPKAALQDPHEPLVTDTSDPHQVSLGMKIHKNRKEQLEADIREIMQLPAGRRFMWDLLNRCNCFKDRVAVAGDPYMTYFNDGQRSIASQLQAHIQYELPTLYSDMILEARSSRHREKGQKRPQRKTDDGEDFQ